MATGSARGSPSTSSRRRDPSVTRSLALFRAVNLGPHGKLPMAELRTHLTGRGFEGVATYIASGNLLVTSPLAGGALEARLEAEVLDRFGLRTDVLARDAAEWARTVAGNPFVDEALREPAKLACMTLKAAPATEGWARLQAEAPGPERMRLIGRRLYLFYGEGVGDSKLTGAFIERRLCVRGTARNWNTVLKLHALLGA